MKALVTGGAGCIGSDLAEKLLDEGHSVRVFDNLSSGKIEHISGLEGRNGFEFIEADLLDFKAVESACIGVDIVFHLAANSDIKFKEGDRTNEDLEQNIIATYNVLEAMRITGVKKIVFTSSSAVYGETKKMPTPENHPMQPISLYGASKASCECLIMAFSSMFGMQSWIFRFANITGGKSRKTGKTVLTDFIERLKKDSSELLILGNGKQSKCYLLVEECIDGMMAGISNSNEKVNIFNLGPEDSVTVDEIASIVADEMGLSSVQLKYSGGDRGWVGDIPKFMLDNSKIKKAGWTPKHSSREAIRIATRYLLKGA